jgi:hypothetical protein
MLSWWWLLCLLPLALMLTLNVVLKWIVVPIRIKRKQRIKAHPAREPTVVDQLTPEMQEFLGRTIGRFREIGFEVALNTRLPDLVSNVVGYHLLFVNRASNDLAHAIIARATNTRTMTVAISSSFHDGRHIVTGSSPQLGTHPRDPTKDAVNFPWATDPGTLWEAHRRRLDRAGRASDPRIAPARGDEMAFVEREHQKERDRCVARGYHRLDPASGDYRLTWKGAFLSAWKLTQPIKRWRIALRDRKARRVWQALGMDALSSPPMPVAPPTPSANSTPMEILVLPDGPLPYASAVAPGQVHRAPGDGGALTVRIGSPTPGQVLAQRWFSLVLAAFWMALLGWTLYRLWLLSTVARFLPPKFHPIRMLSRVMLIWVGLLAWEVWTTVRAIVRARGTVVLVAERSGLRFTNAAGREAAGFVPRDQFESFAVVLDRIGLSGRAYRLEVRTRASHRPIVLARGRDAAALRAAGLDLAEAMGVETPRSVPVPLPVA